MSYVTCYWTWTVKHLCVCVCGVDITTDMTVWDGVVVTPSDKAYEKKEGDDKEAGNEERMEVQDK